MFLILELPIGELNSHELPCRRVPATFLASFSVARQAKGANADADMQFRV